MLALVEADGLQALKIDFLGIAGIRLENNLQLEMHLHAVGVVAKTAVIRPDAGFDINNVPGFRPENAQRGGRIHRACANLNVIRLLDQTTLLFPEAKQAHNHLLKTQYFTHKVPSVSSNTLQTVNFGG